RAIASRGPTATIEPSRMASPPSGRTERAGSIVTTMPPSTSRSAGIVATGSLTGGSLPQRACPGQRAGGEGRRHGQDAAPLEVAGARTRPPSLRHGLHLILDVHDRGAGGDERSYGAPASTKRSASTWRLR